MAAPEDNPFLLDAEYRFLACALYEPEHAAVHIDSLGVECFSTPFTRACWLEVRSCLESGDALDEVLLRARLKDRGHWLPDWMAQLAELIQYMTVPETLASTVRELRDAGTKRKMQLACVNIRSGISSDADGADVLTDAIGSLLDIANSDEPNNTATSRELMLAEMRALEKRYERYRTTGSALSGVSTGFPALDRMIGGIEPGALVVVAGRPGMGKTALLMQLCVAIAETGWVHIQSAEMTGEQLAQRLTASQSRIGLQSLRGGDLKQSDWPRLARAMGTIANATLLVDDTASPTLALFRAKIVRARATYGAIAAACIDYLQLMRPPQAENREREIAAIGAGLKGIAKEYRLPVIALSQLNRKCEERTDKRPRLSDLRDSGSLEQDADAVLFVYRDEVYNQDTPDKGVAEIIVAKNRNGPTGTVTLRWNGPCARFASL